MVALGIGVNAGVFAVDFLVFRYLPYPDPEQLVVLRAEIRDGGTGISAEDFIRLRGQTEVFQNLSASTARAFRLNTRAGSEDITASLVTAGFFQMMGDRFYLGHDFDPPTSRSTMTESLSSHMLCGKNSAPISLLLDPPYRWMKHSTG